MANHKDFLQTKLNVLMSTFGYTAFQTFANTASSPVSTEPFINPHKNKSQTERSGELGGYGDETESSDPERPIHRQ